MGINGKDDDTHIVWKCPECGGVNINWTEWCLHCGFVMDEEPEPFESKE